MKFFTFEVCKQGDIQSFAPIKSLTAFVSTRSSNNITSCIHPLLEATLWFYPIYCAFTYQIPTAYKSRTLPVECTVYFIDVCHCILQYLGQESRGYKFTG